MFPFSQQYSQIDELMKLWKFMEEYQKSQKKDSKMVPAPEPWSVGDYITCYALMNAVSSLCLTALILHYIK